LDDSGGRFIASRRYGVDVRLLVSGQLIKITTPNPETHRLRVNGRLDFKTMLTTVEGIKSITRWWLQREKGKERIQEALAS
jgi:hypothetical protein